MDGNWGKYGDLVFFEDLGVLILSCRVWGVGIGFFDWKRVRN